MPTAIIQSLQLGPGFWTFSLGAIATLCSLAGTLRLARYKYELASYRAETERQVGLREQDRTDLMALCEQGRLGRAPAHPKRESSDRQTGTTAPPTRRSMPSGTAP